MSGADSGPVITPGEPEGSLIVEVQREEHHTNLSEDELQRLMEWIADGAPDS
jgi:hypothetical protein